MSSWWTQTLLILCMFICRLYLTEAGCTDFFNPKYWRPESLADLSEVISIRHSNSFEDMVLCTIKKENKTVWNNIWRDCHGKEQESCETSKSDDKVSFYDFMCLIAKVFEEKISKPDACTYDTVVDLHKKYNSVTTTTRATTTTTTTQMSTTAPTTQTSTTTAARTQTSTTTTTTTARTQKSTTMAATAETTTKMSTTSVATVSTPTTSQPTNVSRTTPLVSRQTSIPSYSDVSDNTNHEKQKKCKTVTEDRIIYSALGLSLVVNLALLFLLWSRRRFNHRTTNRSESHTNGDPHMMEDNPFMNSSVTVTLMEGGTEAHLCPAEDIL